MMPEWLFIVCSFLVAAGLSASAAAGRINSSFKDTMRAREKNASKWYLDESIVLLQKSFETLRLSHLENKLNFVWWGSTATNIARYKKLKALITEEAHREIVEEHESYWRLQFSRFLRENEESMTTKWFAPSGPIDSDESVAPSAIAIVFWFATEGQDLANPFESMDDIELLVRGAVPPQFKGVVQYLEAHQDYWAEVMERRITRELKRKLAGVSPTCP